MAMGYESSASTRKPNQRAGLDIREGTFLTQPASSNRKENLKSTNAKWSCRLLVISRQSWVGAWKPNQRAGLDIREGTFLVQLASSNRKEN